MINDAYARVDRHADRGGDVEGAALDRERTLQHVLHPLRDQRRVLRGLQPAPQQHKADFHRAVATKMLTYALGRGVDWYDKPALDQIVRDTESAGGGTLFRCQSGSVRTTGRGWDREDSRARGLQGQAQAELAQDRRRLIAGVIQESPAVSIPPRTFP